MLASVEAESTRPERPVEVLVLSEAKVRKEMNGEEGAADHPNASVPVSSSNPELNTTFCAGLAQELEICSGVATMPDRRKRVGTAVGVASNMDVAVVVTVFVKVGMATELPTPPVPLGRVELPVKTGAPETDDAQVESARGIVTVFRITVVILSTEMVYPVAVGQSPPEVVTFRDGVGTAEMMEEIFPVASDEAMVEFTENETSVDAVPGGGGRGGSVQRRHRHSRRDCGACGKESRGIGNS